MACVSLDCGLRGIHAHRQHVSPCRWPVRPRHSGVCVRVCLRDHRKKSWKFTGEMFCEGGLAVRGPPPDSGVFSAFQPPVLKRRETHSGNGDNSAVIAGDL